MKQSTIAAIATPIGTGGIGIIRISGPNAFTIVSSVFVPKNHKIRATVEKTIAINMIKTHRLYYGHIVHPKEKNILDEVLVTFMKAPRTYTTEDIAEIQAHSGFVNLEYILSIILELGAVMAKPGEFTKRAFLGGRIDLTQAESVLDLINAKTKIAALNAAKRLEGSKKIALKNLRTTVRKIQANYEKTVEFGEEIDFEKDEYETIKKQLIPEINLLITKEKNKLLYQNGIAITIVGAPNVGKSTLMNCLLEDNRCIVTSMPGTTRDVVKDHISISNLPVILYDTAGLRETSDIVEQISISRTMDTIKKADIILMMVDLDSQLNTSGKEILKKNADKKILIVINKIDVYDDKSLSKFEKIFNSYETIKISAKKKLCIDTLKTTIFKMVTMSNKNNDNIVLESSNLRQYQLLKKTKSLLKIFLTSIRKKVPLDIISYQIEECVVTLDQILGTKKNDDLYKYIFDRFCIGK